MCGQHKQYNYPPFPYDKEYMIDCYKIWSKALKEYRKRFPHPVEKPPSQEPMAASTPVPYVHSPCHEPNMEDPDGYVRLAPPPPYAMIKTDSERKPRKKKKNFTPLQN